MINYRANMRAISRNLFGLILSSCVCLSLSAQNKKTITGDFRGMKLEQFATAIEAQSDYKFYFKSSETDSIVLDFSVRDQPLTAVLDEALAHTDFHYAIDDDHNVFITEKYTIQPNLAEDFFNMHR